MTTDKIMPALLEEQRYKLNKAIDLISDSILRASRGEAKPKIISTWLSVAGDYCHEIAEDLIDETKR